MGRTRNLAKNKRKNPKSLILIITSIIVFITLSFLSINNYRLITKENTKNKELTTKLNNYKNDLINIQKKQTELKEEIEKYSNLDELIKEEKENTFKLASELENKITNKETNYKIAYLTFDDGPYHLTDDVLALLKKHQIKATFFTIGQDKDICYDNNNYSCAETYKKIVDNGHTIANHTYSHAIFRGLYNNADSFMSQVKKQEELIKDRTGVTTNILRFPGGQGTAKALAGGSVNQIMSELKENGYGWVDWTAQDGDGGYVPNYDAAWHNFTSTINEDIEVVLFHDYSTVTYSILEDAINYLENKDYILLPLFYESIKINK